MKRMDSDWLRDVLKMLGEGGRNGLRVAIGSERKIE
jgi:hypothetical protein